MSDFEEAKKMFFHYGGLYFHMVRDNVFDDYKKFNISEDTEKRWYVEMFHDNMTKLLKETDPNKMPAMFNAVMRNIISLNEWSYINFLKKFIDSRFNSVNDFIKLRLIESFIEIAKKTDTETLLQTAKYSLPLLQTIDPNEINKTNPISPYAGLTNEKRVELSIEECMAIIGAELPTKNNPCEGK